MPDASVFIGRRRRWTCGIIGPRSRVGPYLLRWDPSTVGLNCGIYSPRPPFYDERSETVRFRGDTILKGIVPLVRHEFSKARQVAVLRARRF
jgi:hypothetical protein